MVALNIQTFVNLHAYGYTNVYELGPLLDVKTTRIPDSMRRPPTMIADAPFEHRNTVFIAAQTPMHAWKIPSSSSSKTIPPCAAGSSMCWNTPATRPWRRRTATPAWTLALKANYRLLLLDLVMPGPSGI